MNQSAFREQFEPVFQAFLHEKCRADGALAQDGFLEQIIRYPERLAAEGKRIRPYVAWLMYCSQGGRDRQIMNMLTSLELFHIFALIHDDVIDRGTTRHGVPTTQLAVEKMLRDGDRLGEITRMAEGQAILVGDLMFQWSQDAFFSTEGIDPVARERAAPYFRKMIEEVIVGQMIDVDLTTRASASGELIRRKMHLKTSSYTFIRPMQIGAALGGASEEVMNWCEQFGTAVGSAFQTQDDLLDLTIPSEGTGKTAFSDLHERQQTFFTQYIAEHGTDAQKTELASLVGAELSEADRPRVAALFEASGAFTAGRTEVAQLYDEAYRLADNAPVDTEWRDALKEGVLRLRGRSS